MAETQIVTHTPGPWVVLSIDDLRNVGTLDEDLDPDALIVVNVTTQKTDTENGQADVICDLWTLGVVRADRRDEEVANARLIAAAPDLLDAAKWIVSAFRNYSLEAGGRRAYALALDAVAKAEGR